MVPEESIHQSEQMGFIFLGQALYTSAIRSVAVNHKRPLSGVCNSGLVAPTTGNKRKDYKS
ncbi:MAG TPA: hypothetical protein VD794_10545, partial [Flavisolibacter sp.]|nr:hypothetical protein [Flavisolibacter sp.]